MANIEILAQQIQAQLGELVCNQKQAYGELTLIVSSNNLRQVCLSLRDHDMFKFELLLDVCGVDYLTYGITEWQTKEATLTGFSRGVEHNTGHAEPPETTHEQRFGVTYHLLSVTYNQRIRLRVYAGEESPTVPSVVDIWPAANWFEREAFDLFGIIFEDHPDLRRILTDYGFKGHPFRKDFPVIGNVEMRYDATLGRCVYEPVGIQSRTLVPKVIRHDNRYQDTQTGEVRV